MTETGNKTADKTRAQQGTQVGLNAQGGNQGKQDTAGNNQWVDQTTQRLN